MSNKWEVVEVRGSRELDLHAVAMLAIKVVVSAAMAAVVLFALSYGMDKQDQFNANVLDSHISASQRTAVIERGLSK